MANDRKTKTSFALSSETRQLIEELARVFGLSQAGVVEFSVRKLARDEGVTLPESDKKEKKA